MDLADSLRELGLSPDSVSAELSAEPHAELPATPEWYRVAFTMGVVITLLTFAVVVIIVIPAVVTFIADILQLVPLLTI